MKEGAVYVASIDKYVVIVRMKPFRAVYEDVWTDSGTPIPRVIIHGWGGQ